MFIKVDQPSVSTIYETKKFSHERSMIGKEQMNDHFENETFVEKREKNDIVQKVQEKNPWPKAISIQFHKSFMVHRPNLVHHYPPRFGLVPICHQCGRRGHIRPKCIELRKLVILRQFLNEDQLCGISTNGLLRKIHRLIQRLNKSVHV